MDDVHRDRATKIQQQQPNNINVGNIKILFAATWASDDPLIAAFGTAFILSALGWERKSPVCCIVHAVCTVWVIICMRYG